MPNLSIRQVDETTYSRLKLRAAGNGRSMEAEAREILAAAVGEVRESPAAWIARVRAGAIKRSGGRKMPDSTEVIRAARERS